MSNSGSRLRALTARILGKLNLPDGCCCGHLRGEHRHHRHSSECAMCGCMRFRRQWSRRRTVTCDLGLSHAARLVICDLGLVRAVPCGKRATTAVITLKPDHCKVLNACGEEHALLMEEGGCMRAGPLDRHGHDPVYRYCGADADLAAVRELLVRYPLTRSMIPEQRQPGQA